jgi:hypothetical protein
MKQRREEVTTCNKLEAKPEGQFGLGYTNMEGEIIPQLPILHPDFMTSNLQEVFELYDGTLGTAMIADSMRRVNLLCKMSEVGLKGFKLVGGTAWQNDDARLHNGTSVTVRRDWAALRSSPGRSDRHRDDSVSDGLQDGPPDIQIGARMRTNEMTVEIQTLDQTKSHFHLTEAILVLRCRLTTLELISEHLHYRLAGSRKRPSPQSTADPSCMGRTDQTSARWRI